MGIVYRRARSKSYELAGLVEQSDRIAFGPLKLSPEQIQAAKEAFRARPTPIGNFRSRVGYGIVVLSQGDKEIGMFGYFGDGVVVRDGYWCQMSVDPFWQLYVDNRAAFK